MVRVRVRVKVRVRVRVTVMVRVRNLGVEARSLAARCVAEVATVP